MSKKTKLRIELELENAAFQSDVGPAHPAWWGEARRIITGALDKIREGDDIGLMKLRDINGNTCGRLELEE